MKLTNCLYFICISVKFHVAHLHEVQGKYRVAKEHYEALLKEKALPSHLKADICRQLGKSYRSVPPFYCQRLSPARTKSSSFFFFSFFFSRCAILKMLFAPFHHALENGLCDVGISDKNLMNLLRDNLKRLIVQLDQ